jgi:hypothetical protein
VITISLALTSVIRHNGYYDNISITYDLKNEEIIVKADSSLSRWSDDKVVRFLCFITCLWIIAGPLLWLFKKKFGDSVLKSVWNMTISEQDWYQQNVNEIIQKSKARSGLLPNSFVGYAN